MKNAVILLVAIMVLVSANFVFAQDTSVNVDNRSTNTSNATGGNANQNQDQKQKQKQQQQQTTTGVKGNQTVTAPLQAPLLSAFVNAPTSEVPGGWKQITCDSAYTQFTIGELKKMSGARSFFDKRGNFLHAMFTSRVKSSIRIARSGSKLGDDTPIKIINRIPDYGTNAKVHGTSQGIGDYGWPLDGILAASILELVQETGVTDVVVWWDCVVERLAMSSSLGVGFAASSVDGSVSAGSIGASTSKSHTLTEVAYKVKVVAYDKVDQGSDVCNIVEEVRIFSPPPPPPPPAPMPQVQQEQRVFCDPEPIRREIKYLEAEIKRCKYWGINNEGLRFRKANANTDLAKCTGENGYYSEALKDYNLAEENYRQGQDIPANQSEADYILYKVHYNKAFVLRELYGPEYEADFAREMNLNQRGTGKMPNRYEDLKR